MKLTFDRDIYVLESTYEERYVAKDAGFRWNPASRCWWTKDALVASRLAEMADASARDRLARDLGQAVKAEEASRAVDAEVDIPMPPGRVLRGYQKAGVAWCLKYKRTMIADAPGIGKTAQAIGVMNVDGTIKRVLVVCPAIVKLVWRAEIEKFGTRDDLPVTVLGPKDAIPEGKRICIVNYDVLYRHSPVAFDLVVFDEAHYLKAKKTKRTQAAYGFAKKATRLLLLTGTPILNKPVEIWTQLDMIDHVAWGDWWQFVNRFCDARRTRWGLDVDGASHLDELQHRLRTTGSMIRREKAEVLPELPPKTRQVVTVEVEDYEEKSESVKAAEEGAREMSEEMGEAVEWSDGYLEAMKGLKARDEVLFEEIAKVRHDTALAKAPKVVEHVTGILADGAGKVVVWAHHHDVVDALATGLRDEGVVVVDGRVEANERQMRVKAFQEDPAVRVFVGGITAAGIGITLTAASRVVFAELDWVPAAMLQAEDRSHRIGTTDAVLVQHVVLDGSIDAKIAHALVRKQDILDRALDKGVGPERELKEYPIEDLTEKQKAAVLSGLQKLARACDGAVRQDGKGFSRWDVGYGGTLASRGPKTDREWSSGARMIRKYWAQILDEFTILQGGKG